MLVTIGTCRVKREKASLSVDVLCSKTPWLKFPNKIPRKSREHVVQDADCTFLGSYCICSGIPSQDKHLRDHYFLSHKYDVFD